MYKFSRFISLFCVILLSLTLFVCCDKEQTKEQETKESTETQQSTEDTAADTPKDVFADLALWDSSKEQLLKADSDIVVNGDILQRKKTDQFQEFLGCDVIVSYLFENEKLSAVNLSLTSPSGKSVEQTRATARVALDQAYGASSGDDHGAHWHTEHSLIVMYAMETTTVLYFTPIALHSH